MSKRDPEPVVKLVEELPTETRATPFVRTARDSDPCVKQRFAPEGGARSHVITEFAPSAERPKSWPAWLPFLPHRSAWTTESADDTMSPGARWICADPAAVVAALVAESRAVGWTEDAPSLRHAAELTREGRRRAIIVAPIEDGTAVVQLLEWRDG